MTAGAVRRAATMALAVALTMTLPAMPAFAADLDAGGTPIDSTTAVVICDSQCAGDGWTERGLYEAGFESVAEFTFGGGGYMSPNGDLGMSVTEGLKQGVLRLPTGTPGVVAITLGGNDARYGYSDAEIQTAVAELISTVQATYPDTPIVVGGVLSTDGEDHARRRAVDALVIQTAQWLGVNTVSVAGWGTQYGAEYLDGVHLTPGGAATIGAPYGEAVAEILNLGVAAINGVRKQTVSLGAPVGPANAIEAHGGGWVRAYHFGEVAWSTQVGAFAVTDPIRTGLHAMGGFDGPLGWPTGGSYFVPAHGGATVQDFMGGAITTRPLGGTFVMLNGPVRDAYVASGAWEGYLGWPTSDLTCQLIGGDCAQTFDGGAIALSPNGAVTVTSS